jgi:hypothetical protein
LRAQVCLACDWSEITRPDDELIEVAAAKVASLQWGSPISGALEEMLVGMPLPSKVRVICAMNAFFGVTDAKPAGGSNSGSKVPESKEPTVDLTVEGILSKVAGSKGTSGPTGVPGTVSLSFSFPLFPPALV